MGEVPLYPRSGFESVCAQPILTGEVQRQVESPGGFFLALRSGRDVTSQCGHANSISAKDIMYPDLC